MHKRDKAAKTTAMLHRLRRENDFRLIADVIDDFLNEASTETRARLYDLVMSSGDSAVIAVLQA